MEDDEKNPSNASAIIAAVERLSEAQVEDVDMARPGDDQVPILIVPDGKRIESLKPYLAEYLERPERKKGRTRLTSLVSFIEYVNRHKTAHTVVFLDDANPQQPTLRGILNAHEAESSIGPDSEPERTKSEADWQDFTAEYGFPLSDEWKAWTSLPPAFSQADFAVFLEDRITDVIDPAAAGPVTKQFAAELGLQLASPAKLMALSKGLAVHVDARVAQAINLSSGEGSLQFNEEHKDEAGKPLAVPGAFAIAIPVFRLGEAYQLPVRLRYRVQGGRVTWSLSPQRLDRIFEHALDQAAELVRRGVERPLFRGRAD